MELFIDGKNHGFIPDDEAEIIQLDAEDVGCYIHRTATQIFIERGHDEIE